MKIIDLLNDVLKENKIPSSVRYKDKIYCYSIEQYDYCHDLDYLFYNCVTSSSGERMIKLLNEEVEIIEENKKIKKLEKDFINRNTYNVWNDFADKINELIDVINNLKGSDD